MEIFLGNSAPLCSSEFSLPPFNEKRLNKVNIYIILYSNTHINIYYFLEYESIMNRLFKNSSRLILHEINCLEYKSGIILI